MKKFLPLIEIILIVQFILSFVLIMLINAAFVWFLLSGMMLASFYFIATIVLVNLNTNEQHLKKGPAAFVLITQVQLAISITGIIFKVMSFEGASMMLLVSATALLFISILLLINQYHFSRKLMVRSLVFGLLSAFLYWIPLSSWIQFRYYKNPDYAKVYLRYLENPQDSILKYNWMKYREETFAKN